TLLHEIRTLQALPFEQGANDYPDHNARFHATVLELSGNAHLVRICMQHHLPPIRPQLLAFMEEDAYRHSLAEHEDLLFRILDGDARGAEALMRTHVRRSMQRIQRLSDAVFSEIYGKAGNPSSK